MKKILSFILAICLMLPCAFFLSACGNNEPALVEADVVGTYHVTKVEYQANAEAQKLSFTKAQYDAAEEKGDLERTAQEELICSIIDTMHLFDGDYTLETDNHKILHYNSPIASWKVKNGEFVYTPMANMPMYSQTTAELRDGKLVVNLPVSQGELAGSYDLTLEYWTIQDIAATYQITEILFTPDDESDYADCEDMMLADWEAGGLDSEIFDLFEDQFHSYQFKANGTVVDVLDTNNSVYANWSVDKGQIVCHYTQNATKDLEIAVSWDGDSEVLYISVTWPYNLNSYSGTWDYVLERVVE